MLLREALGEGLADDLAEVRAEKGLDMRDLAEAAEVTEQALESAEGALLSAWLLALLPALLLLREAAMDAAKEATEPERKAGEED